MGLVELTDWLWLMFSGGALLCGVIGFVELLQEDE